MYRYREKSSFWKHCFACKQQAQAPLGAQSSVEADLDSFPKSLRSRADLGSWIAHFDEDRRARSARSREITKLRFGAFLIANAPNLFSP
jgi:hypothetical protein